jgi:hypothetical protein
VVILCTTGYKHIKIFYILPTQCIYVFCTDLTTNINYFTIKLPLTVFTILTVCVYRTVRPEHLNTFQVKLDVLLTVHYSTLILKRGTTYKHVVQ